VVAERALNDFVARRKGIARALFFLLGSLTMLSFAPVGWYVLAPALLVPLLWSSYALTSRDAAWNGFWYGCGLFLTGTYWLYISVHVFGEAPLWVAIIIMLGLVMIMGLYYALCCWLINRVAGGSLRRLALVAAPAWVAIEWLRGWFLSGFPWMSLGYAQIDSPLAGFAPLVGVYGVSLLVVVSAVAMLIALIRPGQTRNIAAAVAVLPWIAGLPLQATSWTKPAGPALRTSIIQGGVSQDRKWTREQFLPTLTLYRESLAANAGSSLVVWPEVALPTTIDIVDDYLRQLQREIDARRQTLLLGILERDLSGERIYNSVLMLNGGKRQLYRKRHLVPFGEYFPVPDFVRNWMRLMSLPHNDLAAGDARQPLLTTRDGHALAVAICYEDAYASEQLYALPDASILINVSNDAWFGDSIAPHQHLEIARMRALEVGRYVVRSTNNGISAFIGPDGRILERGAQFEYVALTADVTPLSGLTPFARFGNWPVVSLCLSVLGFFGWSRLDERRQAPRANRRRR